MSRGTGPINITHLPIPEYPSRKMEGARTGHSKPFFAQDERAPAIRPSRHQRVTYQGPKFLLAVAASHPPPYPLGKIGEDQSCLTRSNDCFHNRLQRFRPIIAPKSEYAAITRGTPVEYAPPCPYPVHRIHRGRSSPSGF